MSLAVRVTAGGCCISIISLFCPMRFLSPEWFLLLPALIAMGWFWRGLNLHRPLRALALLLLIFMAVQPQTRRLGDGLDLWVLVDRSDSASELLGPRLAEWETLLLGSKGADDRLRYMDFATEAVARGAQLRRGSSGQQYAGPTHSTRLNSAALHTLSLIDPKRASRLLVLTDGVSTEPLDGLAERLMAQEIAMDYRLAVREGTGDWRIADLAMPRRVQLQQAFLIDVVILGDRDGKVKVTVTRDDQPLVTQEVDVVEGVGRLRLSSRLSQPGAARFSAQLSHPEDALKGNNQASQWVEVQAGPRVLLFSNYPNDPLAAVLAAQGFEVELRTDTMAAQMGDLTSTKVVLMNNVPAYRFATPFLRALDFFVNEQGGGLAMIGGKYSFASGGYFGSAVEPLLPVSMELKQEHRKLVTALAIVMDRSGSMSMTAPGSNLEKIQLANEGAGRAIQLLGDSDLISVFVVDSEAHEVSPLVAVGPNRLQLEDVVRRQQSMGGGIYVYNGLNAAWNQLKQAKVGQRHIILFSDAADSEQPGDYVKLLEEMVREKASVSVIGLGTEQDPDADFLIDIAKRGNGRIFFSQDANELPALFSQETVAIARSTFIEEPVTVKGTPGWLEMAAGGIDWLPQVDGYNLSYLRPGAAQALISADDYAAPMLAFWQRGAGRTAAVAFPLGGDFSQRTRDWPGYGGFVRSLTRWLMGEAIPPGLGLRTELDGSRLKADLFYDESWNSQIAESSPQLLITSAEQPDAQSLPWLRLAPGHFQASIDLEDASSVRGAVRIGQTALPFGPLNVITNPEWSWDRRRLQELAATAARSGGAERMDLSDIWSAPRAAAWSPLTRWLLIFFLLVLLLEAWQTRSGWTLTRRPPQAQPLPT